MERSHFQVLKSLLLNLLVIISFLAFIGDGNNAWMCDSIYLVHQGNNQTEKDYNKFIDFCPGNTENATRIDVNDSNATTWKIKGNFFYNLDRWDEAKKCYEEAINLSPNDSEAWNNLGDTLYRTEKYSEAEQAYNNSIHMNNLSLQAWDGKGRSLVKQNRTVDAFDLYREFKHKFPGKGLVLKILFVMCSSILISFYYGKNLFKIIKKNSIIGSALGFPQFYGNGPTTSDSVDSRLNNFRCIQNGWLSEIFWFTPWILLFSFVYIIQKHNLDENFDLLINSWLIIIALCVFVFNHLILIIPTTLGTLWNRNVFVDKVNTLPEIDGSDENEIRNATLENNYKKFIYMFERKLNSSVLNLIFGVAFGIAAGCLEYLYYNKYIKIDSVENTPIFCMFLKYPEWDELFIVLFAGVIIGLMTWRVIMIGWGVRLLTEWFSLNPQLGHPDRCGGLSPLGNICLLNALIIGIFSSFLGLFIIAIETTIQFIWNYNFLLEYFRILLVILFIISIIAFIWPVWNVHEIMVYKGKVISKKLDFLGIEIDNLQRDMFEDEIDLDSKSLQQRITKLETIIKVYELNKQFREWPFDSNAVKKFYLSIIIPILSLTGLGEWLVNIFINLLV